MVPNSRSSQKADEDGIPLFGWKDDGWLDMCNSPTVNHADVINWFIGMRKKGSKSSRSDMTENFAVSISWG